MEKNTVVLFIRNGMGEGPADLQVNLIKKFLQVTGVPGSMADIVEALSKAEKVISL